MPRLADLAVVVGLSAVAALMVWLAIDSVLLRALLTAPLVFVLPGYAATAALFPRSLDWTEWLLFTPGLSFAIAVLSGLVLNLTAWGLTAQSWALVLFAVTTAASVAALVRRGRSERIVGPSRPFQAPIRLTTGVALGGAALLAAGAMWLARTPVPQQPTQGYTLLWTRPAAEASANPIRVGVRSFEPTATTNNVRIVSGGQTLQEFRVELQPVDAWEADVTLPADHTGNVEILMFRADEPDVIFRRTLVRAGS